jgi:hypothetical protein
MRLCGCSPRIFVTESHENFRLPGKPPCCQGRTTPFSNPAFVASPPQPNCQQIVRQFCHQLAVDVTHDEQINEPTETRG